MILAALNDIIIRAAKAHYLVNEAFVGDVYSINAKENRFAVFVATPISALRSSSGTITYTYTLYYIDRLTKDESNIDLVQSDAVVMLKSLIDEIEGSSINIGDEYEFTLFRHQFDDWCAGAYVSFEIKVPDDSCSEYDFDKLYDLRNINITKNGIYNHPGFDGYNNVIVDVPQVGATEDWVNEQISIELEGYATEDWVEDKLQKLDTFVPRTSSDSLRKVEFLLPDKNSNNLIRLSNKLNSGLDRYQFVTTIDTANIDLYQYNQYGGLRYHTNIDAQFDSKNATKQWVEDKHYLTQHQSLADYAKKTEIPSLTGYATEQWVLAKHYLTQHQDLSAYAKKTDLVNLDGYAKLTDIPSLTGYATEQWVEGKNYLTQHQKIKTINGEAITGEGDITIGSRNFVVVSSDQAGTKIAESDRYHFKTDYVLENYDIYVDYKPLGLTALCTLKRVEQENGYKKYTYGFYVRDLYCEFDFGLVDYDDFVYFNDFTKIDFSDDIDLTDYAKKTDIPSLDGYATESWVEAKHYLTQDSLADYAKKTDLQNIDLTGYATESWVEAKHYLTQHQDISGKVDKAEIWTGNKVQWAALSNTEKLRYTIALIVD